MMWWKRVDEKMANLEQNVGLLNAAVQNYAKMLSDECARTESLMKRIAELEKRGEKPKPPEILHPRTWRDVQKVLKSDEERFFEEGERSA